jgi:tetratricopeptide (TPR) repeat protein
MNLLPILLLSLFHAPVGPLQEAQEKAARNWIVKAGAYQDHGKFDAAVLVIEEHLDAHPDDVEGWRVLGSALQRLYAEGGGSFLVLDDANSAWKRALALEPLDLDTLMTAARLQMQLGAYDEAVATGLRALGICQLVDERLPDGLVELVSRARIGVFQATEHASDEEWQEDLQETWNALRGARELQPGDPALPLVQGGFMQALGVPDLAAELLEYALFDLPEAADLHRSLIDLHVAHGIEDRLPGIYAELGQEDMGATVAWYTGYTARVVGDVALRERRLDDARAEYERSIVWMDAAEVLRPPFQRGTRFVRTQATVSTAWCLLAEGDLAGAQELLFRVLSETPDLRDVRDGLGRSAMNGISLLGQRYVRLSNFARAADVARAVVAVAPEEGSWWNNLGFLLREHGTQMAGGAFPEVEDAQAAAHAIWKESWEAYLRAVELKPDDARIVNDAALMQVYHVRDDLEKAEELLWQAIRTGEAQLQELGPNPPEHLRFPIAQAVGDAYENLGYMHYHLLDEPQESREFWLASQATDSGDRAAFQAYLDSIDGTGEHVEERDGGSFVQGPLEDEPPTATLGWEASFEEGRAAVVAESRPMVVYNRGQALGLAIPFLDRFVVGERFAGMVDGAIVVVADWLRHEFVDRTRDGRRLHCRVWGTVTCGEHIAAAGEFSEWYRASHGAPPGESEEGLWILRPGEDEPGRLDQGIEFFTEELPRLVEASASRSDVGSLDVHELLRMERRAARERIEEILFDPEAPERGIVLLELSERDDPWARGLLAAAASQLEDAPLASDVIALWNDDDLAPVRYAALWSWHFTVRPGALAILEKLDEGHARRQLARRIVEVY